MWETRSVQLSVRLPQDIAAQAEEIAVAEQEADQTRRRCRGLETADLTQRIGGATFLEPAARAVLDVGALHARAMRIDPRSRVLAYRMTSQCASGSGQFLENISRYLGVSLEEVGDLSCQSRQPETVSSICAVLAETDVINMVSRGIETPDILKGIHQSMAGRYVKLLRATGAEGTVLLTGGLAADRGLAEAMRQKVDEDDLGMDIRVHPSSVYAGALGAALWGAYRHRVLESRRRTAPPPSSAPTKQMETPG